MSNLSVVKFCCPHCKVEIETSPIPGGKKREVATCHHCSNVYMKFTKDHTAFGTVTLFLNDGYYDNEGKMVEWF